MNEEIPKIENANGQMKWMILFGLLVVVTVALVAVICLMYEPKKTRIIVGGKTPEATYFFDYDAFSTDNWQDKVGRPHYQAWDYGYTTTLGPSMKQPITDNWQEKIVRPHYQSWDYGYRTTPGPSTKPLIIDNLQEKVVRPHYQAWDYGYRTTLVPSTKQPIIDNWQDKVGRPHYQSVVEVEKQIPTPAVVTEPIMISKILPDANNEVVPVVHSNSKLYKVSNPIKVTDFQFFNNFKNPCFASSEKDIRCFPYFFIAGMPRTGASDLHQRLCQHPHIVGSELKSPDWWTKSEASSKVTLDQYLNHFSQQSMNLKEIAEAESEKGQTQHNSITFDTDPTLFWKGKLDADGTFQTPAHIMKTLPKSKVVLFVRCPTARLYSEYLHFYPKSSPQDFDKFVIKEIADFKICLRTMSENQCTHRDLEDDTVPHLKIGLYSVFYEEWLKTFLPFQILVVRLEDYCEDISKSIKSITDFLELTDESVSTTQTLVDLKTVTGANPNHPEMLTITSDILNSFYQPYNDKFSKLLRNPKLKYKKCIN